MTTYQKILDVSTKLMAKHGYHGTSIQKIADRVGVTKATILHHFESKEGILLSILEKHVFLVLQGLMSIEDDASRSGLEKLADFLNFHMDQVAKWRDVMELLLRESKHMGRKNREAFQSSQREYAKIVVRIIAQIQKENRTFFDGLNPKIAANAILGMCNWTITWFKNAHGVDMDEITRNYSKMIIRDRNFGETMSKSSSALKSNKRGKQKKLRRFGSTAEKGS